MSGIIILCGGALSHQQIPERQPEIIAGSPGK